MKGIGGVFMIKIAIVDDEKIFVSCFQKDLKRLFQQNKVTCIIASFTSGQDFLKNYQETEYDLIFLDIDIPDVSGIQIASDIRNKKLKLNTTLVFVSGHDNFVFESIHYAPFRFIRKANLLMDTEEAVQSFCEGIKENKKYISLDLEGKNNSLEDISKIVYFFSQRHDIFILNSDNKTIRLSYRTYTMDQLEEIMSPNGFIRIHKTYLVNGLYVYKIKGEKVILNDKSEIPLSRIRITEVKEQYQIFLRRNDTL